MAKTSTTDAQRDSRSEDKGVDTSPEALRERAEDPAQVLTNAGAGYGFDAAKLPTAGTDLTNGARYRGTGQGEGGMTAEERDMLEDTDGNTSGTEGETVST